MREEHKRKKGREINMKLKTKKWKHVAIALLSGIALTVPMATIAVSCSSGETSDSGSIEENHNPGDNNPGAAIKHFDLNGQNGNETFNKPDVDIYFFEKEKQIWDTQKILWFENDKPITYTFTFNITNWNASIKTYNSDGNSRKYFVDWGDFLDVKFDVTPKPNTTQDTFDKLKFEENRDEYSNNLIVKPYQECFVNFDGIPSNEYKSYLSSNLEDVPVILLTENDGISSDGSFDILTLQPYKWTFNFGITSISPNKRISESEFGRFANVSSENQKDKWIKASQWTLGEFELNWSIAKSFKK